MPLVWATSSAGPTPADSPLKARPRPQATNEWELCWHPKQGPCRSRVPELDLGPSRNPLCSNVLKNVG